MTQSLDIGPIQDRLRAARGTARPWAAIDFFDGTRDAIHEFDCHARRDVINLLSEVERLRFEAFRGNRAYPPNVSIPRPQPAPKKVEFIPSGESGIWSNIFLDGLKVGYMAYSKLEGGWYITLAKEYGAPRDVDATYIDLQRAIVRVEEELK